MYLILPFDLQLLNASESDEYGNGAFLETITPGVYEIEQIPHPHPKVPGLRNDIPLYWYVLKGTKIGAAIGWWKTLDNIKIEGEKPTATKRRRGVPRDPELDDPMYDVEANPGMYVYR